MRYVWFISKELNEKVVSILNNSKNENTLILEMNMLSILCGGLALSGDEPLDGNAVWYINNPKWSKIEYTPKRVLSHA